MKEEDEASFCCTSKLPLNLWTRTHRGNSPALDHRFVSLVFNFVVWSLRCSPTTMMQPQVACLLLLCFTCGGLCTGKRSGKRVCIHACCHILFIVGGLKAAKDNRNGCTAGCRSFSSFVQKASVVKLCIIYVSAMRMFYS